MVTWLLGALVATAADDVPWWDGDPLAAVALSAPAGGLPDEDLAPLLRVRQGQPLSPAALRTDLATLYRVGSFSSVEAHVQPWVGMHADGSIFDGVQLTYVVHPAPVVTRVRVQGNRAFPDRRLLDVAGLATGQVYYEQLDADFVAERLKAWLSRRGYPRALVSLRATEPSPGKVYVVIDVDEGEPEIVAHLAFAWSSEEPRVEERQLRRWARRAGVAEGEPLAPEDVVAAQDQIRSHLGAMQRGIFRRRRGYTSARVTPAVIPERDGPHVTFTIEPGPKLLLAVRGVGFRGDRKAREALGIDHRLRITRGYLDGADDMMTTYLQERGWLRAETSVTLTEHDTSTHPVPSRTLAITTERGARHTIGDAPDFEFLDFEVTVRDGPPGSEGERLKRDVQAVFDQASVEVIRREFYTEAEMEKGRQAAELLFNGRGYLDAEVTVGEPKIRPRFTLGNLARAIAGTPRHQRVRPVVDVTLGPVTTLTDLVVVGQAPDVPMDWLEEELDERIGAAFSPQAADTLARRIVEAHRAEGYLEADTEVSHQALDEQLRTTTISVVPGDQILLRSITTRGRRLTRRPVLLRTVNLRTGMPIRAVPRPEPTGRADAPRNLEEVRSDLYDLGVFRTVSFELLGDEAPRDLLVAVNERPRTAVEAGGGASTDQGVRAFLRFTQRNLFGLAHQFQLIGQVGLDYRSENVSDWTPDVANPEWRAAAYYTAPRFPGSGQQLTFDVTFRERRQERTLRVDRSGGGASLRASLGARERTVVSLGARLERRQLNQFDASAILSTEPWAELVDLDDPGEPSRWRWQEALTLTLLHDLRDDPLRPTTGALFSVNAELAPGLPWADQPRTAFVKTDARVSGYVPLGGFTLKLAGGGGTIFGLSGSTPPLEDRYRLGGTGSLRGFVRDGVGPHNIALQVPVDWPGGIGPVVDYTSRNDEQRWVPTGGDTSADGTFELLLPLPELGFTAWEGYAGALFLDVGNVWMLQGEGTTGDLVEPTSNDPVYQPLIPFLRWGFGVGARVATPVGPLQLDWAFNPQALLAQGETRRLLRTSWEEPWTRIHLTLGDPF
ncbi:MAG: BamA/TamA family outer membrane protein [Myxococcales bacterium]|nr:BamA/TamA family outer membrane protein [Myxococcales bacterium]